MNNSDMPATACTIEPHPDSIAQALGCGMSAPQRAVYKGLTKHEAFAMAAMQGLLANSSIREGGHAISVSSVAMADALLAELEK